MSDNPFGPPCTVKTHQPNQRGGETKNMINRIIFKTSVFPVCSKDGVDLNVESILKVRIAIL